MPKKSKGKHRLDKFYHLAKEQGYRSRAAFKLIQLNRKYSFLEKARTLLDLCAAPGGWMQVAAKTMPMSSLILGVDLVPIRPIRGTKSIVGDITSQKTRQALKKEAGGSRMDVVVHDGAPNIGGAWASEAYSQAALVLDALRLATEFLVPRGTFVTKVFRSREYTALLYALNQLFERVEATKPAASRNASAEIFVVCQRYKAPAKIDPRLLDARHLFREVVEVPQSMGPNALLKAKVMQKRHREGYEEGASSSRKAAPAAAFIASDAPVPMLGQFTQFTLSPEAGGAAVSEVEDGLAEFVESHSGTTPEVVAMMSDLQVLGRSEFKALLRWQRTVKRDWELDRKAAAAAGNPRETGDEEETAEPGGDDTEEAAEAALLAEMAAAKESADRRAKRERKKRRELKRKARLRAAQLAAAEGIAQDGGDPDQQLFTLAAIKGKGAGDGVAEMAAPAEEELEELDRGESGDEWASSHEPSSGADSDDDRRRYDAMTEEALEDAYQQYQERQGRRAAAAAAAADRLNKRKRLGDAGEMAEGSGSEDGDEGPERARAAAGADEYPRTDSETESDEEPELLVDLEDGRAPSKRRDPAAAAAQWFSQGVFDDPNIAAEVPAAPAAGPAAGKPAGKRGAEPPAAARGLEAEAGEGQSRRGGLGVLAPPAKRRAIDGVAAPPGVAATAAAAASAAADEEELVDGAGAQADGTGGLRTVETGAGAKSEGAGFEEVPLAADDGSSSEDELDDLDENGKAQVLAIARKMIRSKTRQEVLDAAYHRYAFHDDNLPRWFFEDEQRHMRPPEVVSKAEVEEERGRLRAIDARPIKKVAEAKARKRRRLQVRLDAARSKAESIAGQEDVPMVSKMREIEKLYAKARGSKTAGGKGGKSKGRDKGGKKKGPPLDRRMMSDKRERGAKGKKRAAKKGGGGGKNKGVGVVRKGGRSRK